MARARTLLQLRTEVRALSDTVGDPHITDAQILVWINQGIAELWRRLTKLDADRYMVTTPATIATTAGTQVYALPADFMAARVVYRLEGTRRIPIDRFELQQAAYDNGDPRDGWTRTRYRIVGQGIGGASTSIMFDPDPGTASYRVFYIQAPALLSADGDTFDGVAGWEDWVVNTTARKVCIRQETDVSAIDAELMRIDADITSSATHRDVGRAPRIADTRRRRGALRGWR